MSDTFVPLIEMAPALINSRAFFLESARPVATRASTRSVPLLIVGRNFANSVISSAEKSAKLVFLSKRRLVRFSMASAFSLPWTTSVTERARAFWAILCSGEAKWRDKISSISGFSRRV